MSEIEVDHARDFETMVERIRHNKDYPFGGAAVIVPPLAGGESIQILLFDPSADPTQFWSNVSSRITIEVQKLDETQKRLAVYGR